MPDSDFCPTCGQPLPGPDLVSPLEASQILGGVSTRTVTRWADEGRLGPIEMTDGGQRRMRRADVEEFATARAAVAEVSA